jgi:hypothetical protein
MDDFMKLAVYCQLGGNPTAPRGYEDFAIIDCADTTRPYIPAHPLK